MPGGVSSLTEVEALKAERNAGSMLISRMKDAAERQEKIEAMREDRGQDRHPGQGSDRG